MFDKYYTKLSFKSQVKFYLATGSTEDTEIFRFFVGWRLWPTVHATKDSKDHEETIRKKVPDTLTPSTPLDTPEETIRTSTPPTPLICASIIDHIMQKQDEQILAKNLQDWLARASRP